MSGTPLNPRVLGVSYRLPINQSGVGTDILISGISGLRHYVIGGLVTMDADGTLDFLSGSSSLMNAPTFVQGSGFAWSIGTVQYIETEIGDALSIVTTGGKARGFLRVVTDR